MTVHDAHCHFHGGLPAGWLDREVVAAGDPAGVRDALTAGRRAVHRPAPGPAAGLRSYFAYYRAVEAHCRWTEEAGPGTRYLYAQGAVASATAARAHGVTSTCLFFSLTDDRDQMRDRVLGLLDAAARLDPGALTFRLTVPRTRPVSYSPGEILDLLAPLLTGGVVVGVDLSGLDSEVPADRTRSMVDRLLQVGALDRRLPVSVHFGESVPPEGLEGVRRLAAHLASSGVDSVGHGMVLWSPEAYGFRREAVEDSLERCRAAGLTFEVCPSVARLYGCRPATPGPGERVVLGSDAPGLLGHRGLLSEASRT